LVLSWKSHNLLNLKENNSPSASQIIPVKANDYIMYFNKEKEESNKVKSDNKNGFSDFEEKIFYFKKICLK